MTTQKGTTNSKGDLGITVIKKNSGLPRWKKQLLWIRENFENLFRETKVKTRYQEEHNAKH